MEVMSPFALVGSSTENGIGRIGPEDAASSSMSMFHCRFIILS